jgi:flagellin-like protein
MGKRGITPVIATVLLIGVVMALSLIVFFWFRGFTQESITKFGGQNVQIICMNDVSFKASYSPTDGSLSISNTGNVPIYSFDVQIDKASGEYSSSELKDMVTTWPTNGMGQGAAQIFSIKGEVAGASDIILTPILIGSTSGGEKKQYTCPQDQTGKKIAVA